MNYDLEKLNELRAIRKEISSLTWMVFGSMFFVIPACIVVICFGIQVYTAELSLAKGIEEGMKLAPRSGENLRPKN